MVSTNKILIFLFLLFLLQLGFLSCYLPFSEWVTDSPIFTDDYGVHYGDSVKQNYFMRKFGRQWGYDPYQRAGTPTPTIITIDNNGWGLFTYIFFFLPEAVSFKLYFILAILSIPFLCYFSARNFALTYKESILCSFLGTIFSHISICVDFLYWGTVSYIFVCYLSLLTSSVFYRFLKEKSFLTFLGFILVFSSALWIHIFACINLVAPLLILYITFFPKISLKTHGLVCLSIVIVFLINSPWAIPFINFFDGMFINQIWTPYVSYDIFQPIKTYLNQSVYFNLFKNIPFQKSALVDIGLMLFGILGIYNWLKEGEKTKGYVFIGTTIFLFLFSYYGGQWHFTETLTPMRYTIMMNLFLVLPASKGVNKLYELFMENKSNMMKIIFVLVITCLTMIFLAKPYYHLYIKKDFRFMTKIPDKVEELMKWIEKNTTSEGRILIENSDWESDHQYYGTHLPLIFPLYMKREFIGNDYGYNPTKDSFVSYFNGLLFKRPIQNFTLDSLKPYLDLYNIKWVIYWSKPSKDFFESYPEYFVPVKKIDRFYICEIPRKPSFFIEGEGKSSADYNLIELKDIKSKDNGIILSYHWMKYFKTKPAVKIKEKKFLDDPIGFICIEKPPKSLLIYNSYKN